jgi:hypothetical protein
MMDEEATCIKRIKSRRGKEPQKERRKCTQR